MVLMQNLLLVKWLVIARVNMEEALLIEVKQFQGLRGSS